MKKKPVKTKDDYWYLRKFSYILSVALLFYTLCKLYISRPISITDNDQSSSWKHLFIMIRETYGTLHMLFQLKKDGTLDKFINANNVTATSNHGNGLVVLKSKESASGAPPLFCGQRVSVQIAEYKNGDKGESTSKSFILGADATISPLLSAGICQLNIGDEAKIVIGQKDKVGNALMMYDVKIITADPESSIGNFELILGSHDAGPQPICGSLVRIHYTVSDINGNTLSLQRNTAEFIMGFGQAPAIVERAVMQSYAGATVKIIASTQAFKSFNFYRNHETDVWNHWVQGVKISKEQAIVLSVVVDQVQN